MLALIRPLLGLLPWFLLANAPARAAAQRALCTSTLGWRYAPASLGVPFHLRAFVGSGLRLRGGVSDDPDGIRTPVDADGTDLATMVESQRAPKGQKSMEVVNKIRARRGKRIGETVVEQAVAIVPSAH